jgi:hypothetical protein
VFGLQVGAPRGPPLALFGNVANLLADELAVLIAELEKRTARTFSVLARDQLAEAYLEALRTGRNSRSDLQNALLKTASALLRSEPKRRERGRGGPCSLPPIPRGARCRRCGFPLTRHKQPVARSYFDGD